MKNGFQKFKSKLFRSALSKGGLYGISIGLLAAGALIAATKFTSFTLNFIYIILIGVGVAAVSGTILFLLLRPSDQKVAVRLDNSLSLHEKVRTMVAFRNCEGDMLEMQRIDTENKLSDIPAKKLRVHSVWISVLTFVLSVALCAGAFLIPVAADPPPDDPTIDEYSHGWIIIRLEELIQQVQKSFMQEPVKVATVSQLQELLETVRSTDKESLMKAKAIETVKNVNGIVENANSANEIATAFASVSEKESIKALATAIDSFGGTALKRQMRTIRDALSNDSELENELSDMIATLDAALRISGISAEDSLYSTFKTLRHSLSDLNDQLSNANNNQISQLLNEAFDTAANDAADALMNQRDNRSMGDTVIRELMSIFSITNEDLIEEGDTSSSSNPGNTNIFVPDDSSKDENEKGDEGGLGSGQVIYGSDDTVYDPDTESLVTYGEIIDRYFSKILALKQDGKLTEEMAEAFDDYFAHLYNSSK